MKTPIPLELTLCEQLPWGLKIHDSMQEKEFLLSDDYFRGIPTIINDLGRCILEQCTLDDYLKPILFSMDCLTKEITLKDYNDGKPFVPIMELAKTNPKFICEGSIIRIAGDNIAIIIDDINGVGKAVFLRNPYKNSLLTIDFLNRLHFNTRNLSPDQFVNAYGLNVY